MSEIDPNTTHRLTTATVPEWAEAATGDARDAEIARLRETLAAERAISNGLSTACCKLKVELADVKAENCALVCRNGDLEAMLRRVQRTCRLDEDPTLDRDIDWLVAHKAKERS